MKSFLVDMSAPVSNILELVRHLVTHGDAREGKWRGNWRMEWVASTLTPPPNVVYPTLLKLMRKPRLPAVDWTDAPTDLNGLVCFGERRNLVSARVSSRSARAIPRSFHYLLRLWVLDIFCLLFDWMTFLQFHNLCRPGWWICRIIEEDDCDVSGSENDFITHIFLSLFFHI